MILLALSIYGGGIAGFGLLSSYPAALIVWTGVGGATVLYHVSTTSLRRRIVPNELLSRVWNVAVTFAWCAIPVGSRAAVLGPARRSEAATRPEARAAVASNGSGSKSASACSRCA
jgi:hypothetical protein